MTALLERAISRVPDLPVRRQKAIARLPRAALDEEEEMI
jgi:hypothetical protein